MISQGIRKLQEIRVQRRSAFLFLFFLICLSPLAEAQPDTNLLKRLYDRALDFDESKIDSLRQVAAFIDQHSLKLDFQKGTILSNRLKGIASEYKGDYGQAIDFYLACLEQSRQLGHPEYEESALSDLALVYSELRNPAKAKEYLVLSAKISEQRGELHAWYTSLINLGAICNQLDQPDSALYYLDAARTLTEANPKDLEVATLINNYGNAWFQKKEWSKALDFFRKNFHTHLKEGDKGKLWYDVLNMSDVFIELRVPDSAAYYLSQARVLARELDSRRKEADVEQLFAKLHASSKDYSKAYHSFLQWYSIDSSLVNAETRETILDLEERYKVREREHENNLLTAALQKQRLQNRVTTIAGTAIALLAVLAGLSYLVIRKKNRALRESNKLIVRQNDKLTQLNSDKNALISIVSHDLSAPFTSINMWSQLMEQESTELNENQRRAINRIKSSTDHGIRMINNILDVERLETNARNISFELIDLRQLLQDMLRDLQPLFQQKNLNINDQMEARPAWIQSDPALLKRIFGNLISNAIKFTPEGKNIYVSLAQDDEQVTTTIRDEGQGIPLSEQGLLFKKYSRLSSRPTGGEPSTGLGLSIVKRLVDELHGQINFHSTPGAGSSFSVIFTK